MLTVYRVEHFERRVGPYRDLLWRAPPLAETPGIKTAGVFFNLREQLGFAHQRLENTHPDPWTPGEPWSEWDGPAWTPYNVMREKFGFLYLQDLHMWFEGWMEILASHGYIVWEYRVLEKNIRLGNYQISFRED